MPLRPYSCSTLFHQAYHRSLPEETSGDADVVWTGCQRYRSCIRILRRDAIARMVTLLPTMRPSCALIPALIPAVMARAAANHWNGSRKALMAAAIMAAAATGMEILMDSSIAGDAAATAGS